MGREQADLRGGRDPFPKRPGDLRAFGVLQPGGTGQQARGTDLFGTVPERQRHQQAAAFVLLGDGPGL